MSKKVDGVVAAALRVIFALIYGGAKSGKTTDVIYAFPHGLFIADEGAMQSSISVVGWMPDRIRAQTLDDLLVIIQTHGASGKYEAIIGDDLYLLVQQTVAHYEGDGRAKIAKEFGKKPSDGFLTWIAILERFEQLARIAAELNVHVVLNCHEVAPPKSKKSYGTMHLPGSSAELLERRLMTILHLEIDPLRVAEEIGWGAVYRSAPKELTGWIAGDRYNAVPDKAPANMGEMLRCAGFSPKRPFDWMERYVEALSQVLATDACKTKQGRAAMLAQVLPSVRASVLNDLRNSKIDARLVTTGGPDAVVERLVTWILRDAYDRVVYRRAKASPLRIFGVA